MPAGAEAIQGRLRTRSAHNGKQRTHPNPAALENVWGDGGLRFPGGTRFWHDNIVCLAETMMTADSLRLTAYSQGEGEIRVVEGAAGG